MIRVGDTVWVDMEIVSGQSTVDRSRYVGEALVTVVAPTPRVKSAGFSFDHPATWSQLQEIPKGLT